MSRSTWSPGSPGAAGARTQAPTGGFAIAVLEGEQAGIEFDLLAPAVQIGRGDPLQSAGDAVLLSDRTVSSRQAVLRRLPEGWVLEHDARATNPTFVNGQPASRARLSGGDRIRVGHTLLELRERRSPALDVERTEMVQAGADQTVQVQSPVGPARGFLVMTQGPPELLGRRFPLLEEKVSIGRRDDCQISIAEPSLSRVHAAVVAGDGGLTVEQYSRTNGTFVNGVLVEASQALADGDEIRLADKIAFRLEAPALRRPVQDPSAASLRSVMEARLRIEERIEDFVRTGSFLDIDVVDSYGMKSGESRADRIVVSFERFRSFLQRAIEEQGGRILNCNGDEVMAFFDSADDSVEASRAIVAGLDEFNRSENALSRPFEVRMGIHTGRSAVDFQSGVAYSPVLDGAGHLQKEAPVGGVLISGETLRALSSGDAFTRVGISAKDGLETWLLEP